MGNCRNCGPRSCSTQTSGHRHTHTHTQTDRQTYTRTHRHTHMSLVMSIVYPAAAALGFLPCSRQCIFQQFADQQQQLHLLAVPASAAPTSFPASSLLPLSSSLPLHLPLSPFALLCSVCSSLAAANTKMLHVERVWAITQLCCLNSVCHCSPSPPLPLLHSL